MNLKMRFAALAALSLCALTTHAATYAVLIGINDYPDVVDSSGNRVKDEKGNFVDDDLKGAVNDVTAWKGLLTGKYGVPGDNVKMLTDKDANETKFVETMKWMFSNAKSGDQILFFYSGHGGQIKTTNPEEEDGLEEVIVLADRKLVPDNLFGELAKVAASRGINATFVFDSCHSGGMSRDGARTKFLNLAQRSGHVKAAQASLDGVKTSFRQAAPAASTGSFAFLFAGQEDQPTIDISGMKDIPAHGVFTLFVTAALNDAPAAPIKDLIPVVTEVLRKLEFKQVPRFETSSPERGDKPVVLN